MKYFFSLVLALLLFSNLSFGEKERKTLKLNEIIYNSIVHNNGLPVIISNVDVITDNFKYRFLFEYLESQVSSELFKTEDGKVIMDVPITFKNCSFGSMHFDRLSFISDVAFMNCSFEDELKFTESNFAEVSIEDCTLKSLIVDKCEFKGHLLAEWNTITQIKLFNSNLKGITKLVNHVDKSIEINNCIFFPQQFPCTIVHDSIGYGRPIYNNLQLIIANVEMNTIDKVILRNNSFRSHESINKVAVQADINQLFIEDNFFRSSFDMNKTSIEKRLIIRRNLFHNYIGFNDVIFPELFNIIDWDQFSGFKLSIFEPAPNEIKFDCPPNYKKVKRISDLNSILYLAENENELLNKDSYNLLISIYQRLYNIYKSNGDIKSSNGCYSEMKDVQSRMLKFNFKEKKSFNNFFRWKLAQLLKTYVDHGTDPARAISISVYVILLFAVFYFFFPSEWDVTSKSKLLKEFSDYIRHIQKGNLKNFLITVWGLAISFLNALTLSLNAFTTLGFGNIPTQGAARYICIVQGFIGWFLLSIFTVALINQVLG